jgi:hypothetical protein
LAIAPRDRRDRTGLNDPLLALQLAEIDSRMEALDIHDRGKRAPNWKP